MPEIKVTEYLIKHLWDDSHPSQQSPIIYKPNHILKVDQFTKRRGKKGLVAFPVSQEEIDQTINKWDKYQSFIYEPLIEHDKEYYISLTRQKTGFKVIYSEEGGINLDFPEKQGQIYNINYYSKPNIENKVLNNFLEKAISICNQYYINFLECNPLIKKDDTLIPLDFAVEIDACCLSYIPTNTRNLIIKNSELSIPNPNSKPLLPVEKKIKELDANTGSSLKFKVLNPQGKIWTLVAGGGASVAFTDAITNKGWLHELANYGEYSGNPSKDDVFQYCDEIFKFYSNQEYNFNQSLDHIKLFITGGIANFTDVSKTFEGIKLAITKHLNMFHKNNVHIYLRRGGLNEEEGLLKMANFLQSHNIPYNHYQSDLFITKIVDDNLEQQPINPKLITEKIPTIKYEINNYDFFKNTSTIVIGQQLSAIQRMIDFEYACNKEKTNITYIYDPMIVKYKTASFFWGSSLITIPIINSPRHIKSINYIAINFGSLRSAPGLSEQLINSSNPPNGIVIIAEGIPEWETIKLSKNMKDTWILGPSTVGAIHSGHQRFGNTGGEISNIERCNLHEEGNIGIITRSGGMLNELIRFTSSNNHLINKAISIGGDKYPCTNFLDVAIYYEKDPKIEFIIVLGEEGGLEEYKLVQAQKDKVITKPIILYCLGITSSHMTEKIEFGHAGASSSSKLEQAQVKNYLIKQEPNFYVPNTFEELPTILENFKELKQTPKTKMRPVPLDFNKALENNIIRKKPEITTTVSNEIEELHYRSTPLSEVLKEDNSLGNTIGLLWLNRKLDPWASKFIEKILTICAEHGPAVSGAHNTIITSRAGMGLNASLCSGLLTIGPRFGGAIAKAGEDFYTNYSNNTKPEEFIASKKSSNQYIMGIGHRIKSVYNPDKRVEWIKNYVKSYFPSHSLLSYAEEVEKITISKRSNLILNVDGALGSSLVDLLKYYEVDLNNIFKTELLNAFFMIGRSIGFIAHYQDQKELNEPLYRTEKKDIHYKN